MKQNQIRRVARSAPSSDQVPSREGNNITPYNNNEYVNYTVNHNSNSKSSYNSSSIGNPFALEFERAKTKVLSREVKKMRKAILHDDAPWSPINKTIRGAGANTPVQLTPEAERRSRLVTEAREQLAGHKSKFQERIMERSQRLYDWTDPNWIEKKTDLEAAMLIQRYANARSKVNAMNNKTFERDFGAHEGKMYTRQQRRKRRKKLNEHLKKKVKLEQGWNNSSSLPLPNSRGGGYGTLIPRYDATVDPNCTYTRTQAFKESPYMRMVKNSAFPKRFNGSKLTKKHHKEAALMSQAHAAALQASAARAAAAEKESSVIGWNNVDDASIRANKIARLEIELYKTISTYSIPPEAIEKVLSVIFTDLFFGIKIVSKPNAAALLTIAPKLFVSWI